jgi:lipoic acid synthetase
MSMNISPSKKQRGAEKLARIPIKVAQETTPLTSSADKPRITLRNIEKVEALRKRMREHRLVTVCEEASCPNLNECFSHGTASFMIMGDKCTRRCAFCDVAHGRPDPLDPEEPQNLAKMIKLMGLRYIVITSVDRDDLRDGGAGHFANCINALREAIPELTIEILVPDFRGRRAVALAAIEAGLPDVFNHNIETVPRLYKQARPGSDYMESLRLLQEFKRRFPHIPTKSGLMLGLGETLEEVEQVMIDLRAHDVDMVTLGQYLAPSRHHLPVTRYITSQEFKALGDKAKELGFKQVASGPLVRSSYHADQQAAGIFEN